MSLYCFENQAFSSSTRSHIVGGNIISIRRARRRPGWTHRPFTLTHNGPTSLLPHSSLSPYSRNKSCLTSMNYWQEHPLCHLQEMPSTRLVLILSLSSNSMIPSVIRSPWWILIWPLMTIRFALFKLKAVCNELILLRVHCWIQSSPSSVPNGINFFSGHTRPKSRPRPHYLPLTSLPGLLTILWEIIDFLHISCLLKVLCNSCDIVRHERSYQQVPVATVTSPNLNTYLTSTNGIAQDLSLFTSLMAPSPPKKRGSLTEVLLGGSLTANTMVYLCVTFGWKWLNYSINLA